MILLDTHIWIWWVHGSERLTPAQLVWSHLMKEFSIISMSKQLDKNLLYAEEALRCMLLEKLGEKKYRDVVFDSLSVETKAWELASDEALENFEKGLNR